MGATNHTPGPWRAGKVVDTYYEVSASLHGTRYYRVAQVDGDPDRVRGDAALIAAAPDLLAACEMIATGALAASVKAARAAIAKAKGEA